MTLLLFAGEQRAALKFVMSLPVGSIILTVCFPSVFWFLFVITEWVHVFKKTCIGRQDCKETLRAIPQFEVGKTGAVAALNSK